MAVASRQAYLEPYVLASGLAWSICLVFCVAAAAVAGRQADLEPYVLASGLEVQASTLEQRSEHSCCRTALYVCRNPTSGGVPPMLC